VNKRPKKHLACSSNANIPKPQCNGAAPSQSTAITAQHHQQNKNNRTTTTTTMTTTRVAPTTTTGHILPSMKHQLTFCVRDISTLSSPAKESEGTRETELERVQQTFGKDIQHHWEPHFYYD
jgi:hypothetical protein